MANGITPEIDNVEDAAAAQMGLSLSTKEARRQYLERVHAKWHKSGWLNTDADKMGKANFAKLRNYDQELSMALILESQRKFQRQHSSLIPIVKGTDGRLYADQSLVQDVSTPDLALPTTQVMPIVRRAYAKIMQARFSVTQPMVGPSSFVFYLDFIREVDTTNLLSVEYNKFLTGELGVPNKGKLSLARQQINAVKQLLGIAWSLESEEDAQAILGMDVESELMRAFTDEFVRNLFKRHLDSIQNAALNVSGALNATAPGTTLPAPWNAANPLVQIAAQGGTSITDYKSVIFNRLIDADTNFQLANYVPSNAIMAGIPMANFLRKMLTATGAVGPDDNLLESVGISNYGTYDSQWTIYSTPYIRSDTALLFRQDPDPLYAGHIYSPYVPLMATPRVYADFDTSTGAYSNKDAYTRNLRERSADIVTKPYSFMPLVGPPGLSF